MNALRTASLCAIVTLLAMAAPIDRVAAQSCGGCPIECDPECNWTPWPTTTACSARSWPNASPGFNDDAFYARDTCQFSDFINDANSRFGMSGDDWNGFGMREPCSEGRPYKRTLNALRLLAYAGTDTPSCSGEDAPADTATSVYNAFCWAGAKIRRLVPECDGDSSDEAAWTWAGPWPYIDLYWPFFYDLSTVQRAATLVHEARHADDCYHDEGDNCKQGGSCDSHPDYGCWGDLSSGPGANGYEFRYLLSFLRDARDSWITPAIRAYAHQSINDLLDNAFIMDGCRDVDPDGVLWASCLPPDGVFMNCGGCPIECDLGCPWP